MKRTSENHTEKKEKWVGDAITIVESHELLLNRSRWRIHVFLPENVQLSEIYKCVEYCGAMQGSQNQHQNPLKISRCLRILKITHKCPTFSRSVEKVLLHLNLRHSHRWKSLVFFSLGTIRCFYFQTVAHITMTRRVINPGDFFLCEHICAANARRREKRISTLWNQTVTLKRLSNSSLWNYTQTCFVIISCVCHSFLALAYSHDITHQWPKPWIRRLFLTWSFVFVGWFRRKNEW